jgi:CubicO group peptidase (beta-lactamase class C family)
LVKQISRNSNTSGFKVSNPEENGFSSASLKRLTRLLHGYIDRGDLPGIIATIAHHGHTVYYEKFGWMDIEAQKPIQDDTIFMIASMTKPVTSVAMMMLYEEGHFHLNTPVWKFIPGFKDVKVCTGFTEDGSVKLADLEREITIRHLFTHTAGLSYGWMENDPVDQEYRNIQKRYEDQKLPISLRIFAEELSHLPIAYQPGTHWRYSYSIDILGALVEIISGMPYEKYLQERVFHPLGMVDTNFYVPADKMARVATVYRHDETGKTLVPIKEIKPSTESPSFPSPGGGLVSTISDYARFCQMLVNGGELDGVRLLGPKSVAMYSINHTPSEALPYGFSDPDLYHAGYGYSLGTRVLMDVSKTGLYGSVGEFGWDGAFATYFWIDPKEALYGLMMLQHSPNAYYPIHPQFKQLTYQAMLS